MAISRAPEHYHVVNGRTRLRADLPSFETVEAAVVAARDTVVSPNIAVEPCERYECRPRLDLLERAPAAATTAAETAPATEAEPSSYEAGWHAGFEQGRRQGRQELADEVVDLLRRYGVGL